MVLLVKFVGLFDYKSKSRDVISSQVVGHKVHLLWLALTMDGRQSLGENSVSEQLFCY